MPRKTRKNPAMTAKKVHACRRLPSITASMAISEVGMAAISRNSITLVSGVGFSDGCAELALNQPPPLVPRCLMLILAATGRRVIVCWPCEVNEGVGTGVGATTTTGAELAALVVAGV